MPMRVKANGTPASSSRGCADRAANVDNTSSKSGDCPDAYEDAYWAPTARVEIRVSTKSEMAIASDLRRLRVSWISQYGLAGNSQVCTTGVTAPEEADSKLLLSVMNYWMHLVGESKPGWPRRSTPEIIHDPPKVSRSGLPHDSQHYAGNFSNLRIVPPR